MVAKVPAAGVDLDGAITINESSASVDFRVESNGLTHALFVDASADRVGFITTPDLGNVHIRIDDTGASSSNDADELVLEKNGAAGLSILSANDSQGNIFFGDDGDNDIGRIIYNHNNNRMSFRTNATEALAIDSTGAVNKPLQPCFRVTSGTQNNIPVNANQTAVFDSVVFDIGGDFASNTFTAPVTGKYFFTVSFRWNSVDSAGSYLQTVLVGSNRNTTLHTLDSLGVHLSGDGEYSHTGTVILDMDTGDTAYVRIRIQGGTAQTDVNDDGSYFSGYLIC